MFKKLFVACIAIFGLCFMIKGFVSIFDIKFNFLNNKTSYNLGYNLGLILAKIFKIGFGTFIIWQCYKWFCDEENNDSSLIKF